MLRNLSAEEKAASRKVLVAVIDASESHRRQVAQALTSFYRVATFDRSDEAIAALHETPPCAVLVDKTVPPLGGYAFIKLMRSEKSLADVPIIFTDNADDGSVYAAALECGAD